KTSTEIDYPSSTIQEYIRERNFRASVDFNVSLKSTNTRCHIWLVV
ncbi:45975_t:CDS:1, partial [Gigaspora margarita]